MWNDVLLSRLKFFQPLDHYVFFFLNVSTENFQFVTYKCYIE